MRTSLNRRSVVLSTSAAAASWCLPSWSQQPALRGSTSGALRHLAYSDQGGRPDGVQAMVSRKHLFVGHMFSNGFTVLDVADPSRPRPVKFIAAPPNTRTHHLQTAGDLMLVVCGADIPTIGRYNPSVSYYEQSFAGGLKGKAEFAAGLKVYDISRPAEPREIGFLEIPGIGLNRLWYTGGRYAYLSAHMDGFTDHILVIADMSDPTKPTIAGRWWLPGMWAAGGEKPSWSGKRVALHHMLVTGPYGYAAWRDGGFTLLDVSDPARIRLVSRLNTSPPFPGGTHTILPLPGRQMCAMLDEANGFACAKGLSYTWLLDMRSPENPVPISTLPTPAEQQWCRPGEKFGPHNLYENRPDAFVSEDLLFATYLNAGLRVFDIRNSFAPREIASFVPPPPTRILDPRPGSALAPQTCDVNVQPDGTVYMTDWNAGLHVLRYEG
jgi:hypothetical protein